MSIVSTSFDSGMFTLSYVQSARAASYAPHAHDRAYFTVVLEGCLREDGSQSEEFLRPDELQFHPRGFAHHPQIAEAPFTALVAEVNVAASPFVCSMLEVTKSFRVPREALEDLPQRLCRELRRNDSASRYVLEALLVESVAAVARAAPALPREQPTWFTCALSFIAANLGRHARVEEIADIAGTSETTLNAAFRQYTGMPVSAYVRRERLQRAAAELLASRRTIQQIAGDYAFSDQAHFSRRFREAFGTTPRDYRRAFRGRV